MNYVDPKHVFPCEEAAAMLKVVAHPVRLMIILALERGERNVKEIQSELGLKQSMTSQHLGALSGKGILGRRKEGNEVFYFISKKEVMDLLSCVKGCCNAKKGYR